jgi:hypothetical protein
MKKLKPENLKSRRAFLRGIARKSAVPVVTVYVVSKTTPKVFAREPE